MVSVKGSGCPPLAPRAVASGAGYPRLAPGADASRAEPSGPVRDFLGSPCPRGLWPLGRCLWGEELAGLQLELEFGEFLQQYAADFYGDADGFDDPDDEFFEELAEYYDNQRW